MKHTVDIPLSGAGNTSEDRERTQKVLEGLDVSAESPRMSQSRYSLVGLGTKEPAMPSSGLASGTGSFIPLPHKGQKY